MNEAQIHILRPEQHLLAIFSRYGFHFDSGQLASVSTSGLGRRFESLDGDDQTMAIRVFGVDPSKVSLDRLTRMVPAVRAAETWLDADPGRSIEDLQAIVMNAPYEGQTS